VGFRREERRQGRVCGCGSDRVGRQRGRSSRRDRVCAAGRGLARAGSRVSPRRLLARKRPAFSPSTTRRSGRTRSAGECVVLLLDVVDQRLVPCCGSNRAARFSHQQATATGSIVTSRCSSRQRRKSVLTHLDRVTLDQQVLRPRSTRLREQSSRGLRGKSPGNRGVSLGSWARQSAAERPKDETITDRLDALGTSLLSSVHESCLATAPHSPFGHSCAK
jgi:hypothetical protein